jgi:DNA-directed RNA polymerase subunit RPC12/RpoP
VAVVYRHIRLDKKEVFYIGIGSKENRAYSLSDRNKYWQNVANFTDYKVEILFDDLDWNKACEKEKELISLYGRKDLGLGTLVNLTDGGEGNLNLSEESKKAKAAKISKSKKGVPNIKLQNRTLSATQKEKIRLKLTGGKHPPEVNKKKGRSGKDNHFYGKKHTQESIEKNRLAHIGKKPTPESLLKRSKATKGVQKGPQKEVQCPYCNKAGGQGNMKRYHFDNCLQKGNTNHSKRVGHRKKIKDPTVVCTYCNKSGNKGIMQRWHFNNCKQKLFINNIEYGTSKK